MTNEPIPGQSHWCNGKVQVGIHKRTRCWQIVANNSDHCEAGHQNIVRWPGDIDPTATHLDLKASLESDGIEDILQSSLGDFDPDDIIPQANDLGYVASVVDIIHRGLGY